jgi:hypothetical protein
VDAPDKPVGLGKTSNVYLWIVPARVHGLWCGAGKSKGRSLTISQKFQRVRIDVPEGATVRALDGRVQGRVIRTRGGALNFTYDGQKLRATYAGGPMAAFRHATFVRPRGQSCE